MMIHIPKKKCMQQEYFYLAMRSNRVITQRDIFFMYTSAVVPTCRAVCFIFVYRNALSTRSALSNSIFEKLKSWRGPPRMPNAHDRICRMLAIKISSLLLIIPRKELCSPA